MTVEELIEELRHQPNPRVPVQVEVTKRDEGGRRYTALRNVDGVR